MPDIVEPESLALTNPAPVVAPKFIVEVLTAVLPEVPLPPLVLLLILNVGADKGPFLINVILSAVKSVVVVLLSAAVFALQYSISTWRGSFKLSVKYKTLSKILTPVIKLASLKFKMLPVSTKIPSIASVATLYSAIISLLAEVINQYILSFSVSLTCPIQCALVKLKESFCVLPKIFFNAPTSLLSA